ncbi:retron Ec78 anti-phage system effector ATPase PtuA [Acinetobacter lwoffii]|uniref:retron Ec78 anti-phage system effector ATPase PtuA n=1 Tax=Acinetobacter lwoffii TaxID=28090 RepID=UPI003F90E698
MKKLSNYEHLQANANKGILTSMFQLYLNEANKESKDSSQEKLLFDKCYEYLDSIEDKPVNHFFLQKLELYNFRKFETLHIDFHKNLTVLIGGNGEGKSSIIDAITKTLSWIGNGILKEGDNGRPITYDDIKNDCTTGAEIISFFKLGKTEINGNISRSIEGAATKKNSQVADLKNIANIYRVINNISEINLPLLCSYPVERTRLSIKASNKNKNIDLVSLSKFDIYKNSLDGSISLNDFSSIFISIYNKSQSEIIEKVESIIKELSMLKSIDNDDTVLKQFIKLKEVELRNISAHHNFELYKKYNFFLDTIKKSLVNSFLNIKDITVNDSSGKDQVYFNFENGNIVNFNQLSHGQKLAISLIGDICIKLLFLNPKLKNPLNGQGIVLIDELELHLHPQWQQRILLTLQQSFPNIQFIVSTHSPQILSTVDKLSIRKLANSSISTPIYQTQGVMSSEILEQIMETSSVPEIQISKDFERYLSLIEQDLHEEREGKALEEKLYTHFGENHPIVKEYQSQIKLLELKKKIANRDKN